MNLKIFRMHFIVFLVVITLAGFAASEQYTDRYDDINIDEILANKRLLDPYVKCMLEKGRCVPEGRELKAHIKEAMENGCEKCTVRQKQMARKVVKHLKEKEDDYYKQLLAKYDPEDKNKPTYEAFLAADD